MKKIILLFLFQMLFMNLNFAQCTDESLLFKYWQQRERFEQHFIKTDLDEDGNLIGDGIGTWDATTASYTKAGYSLPVVQYIITERMYDGSNVVDPKNAQIVNTEGRPDGVDNIINIGADQTYSLGMYIAMLSSEYELLYKNDAPASQKQKTLNELFLALQAIRRLDMTANRINAWHCASCIAGGAYTPNLSGYSGFLLREDTPPTFHSQIDDNSYPDHWRVGGTRSLFATEDYYSDLPCNFRDNEFRNRIAGQDQFTGLLFGLSFVKKFIPESISITYNSQEYFLLKMAQDIANGIVRRVRVHPHKHIAYPACDNEKKWGPSIGNGNGGDASASLHGMIRALDYIFPDNEVNSTAGNYFLWQNYISLAVDGWLSNDNERMALELMIAGNTNFGTQAYGRTRRFGNLNLMQLYGWALLHDEDLSHSPLGMKEILCTFGCEGSCNAAYTQNDEGEDVPAWWGPLFDCSNTNTSWCSGERWKHASETINNCGEPGNGIVWNGQKGSSYDFMLAYNLYHLYERENEVYFNPFQVVNDNDYEEAIDNINGDEFICDEDIHTYGFSGNPAGFDNIEWTVSDNLTIITPSSNTFSVDIKFDDQASTGEAWVRVTYSEGECNFARQKNIWIGNPPTVTNVTEDSREIPCGEVHDLVAISNDIFNGSNSTYEWTFNGPSMGFEYFSDGKIAKIFAEDTESATVYYTVTISNECGESDFTGSVHVLDTYCDGDGGGPLIIGSPNPADNYLDVELTNVPIDIFADGSHIEYLFIDQYSDIQKTVTSTSLIKNVTTSDLPNGIYYIMGILGDQTLSSSPIIIQH